MFSSHGGIGSADKPVVKLFDGIELVTVMFDREGATINS